MKNELLIKESMINKILELSDAGSCPFYIYDTDTILQNCKKFTDIPYNPKSIHFALMANANPQFVRIIKNAGLNVFVNSLLHLDLVRELGYDGEEIVYAASAMDDETMSRAQSCHSIVVLDSPGQLARWQELFPDTRVSIRCNIGELVVPQKTRAGYFIGKESRLGFMVDEIRELAGNKTITGLHSYVGTDIMDIDYFMECYEQMANLAELFPKLRFLDFGGGFGLGDDIERHIDLESYSLKIKGLMTELSEKLGREIRLLLEPGRIIGGEAGLFVCKVVDIKKRDGQQLIGVNASCVQFPRPLFYPDSAFHPVTVIHRKDKVDTVKKYDSSVFGCSTYSRDFLTRNVQLPETSVGDLVIMGYAGSYCAGLYTKFLGFPEVQEYFI
ncbi:MAG: hypothetical protein R6V77_07210 [Candidatus Cloacimonadaceae bacterium]